VPPRFWSTIVPVMVPFVVWGVSVMTSAVAQSE
jgi:hypothetical protein